MKLTLTLALQSSVYHNLMTYPRRHAYDVRHSPNLSRRVVLRCSYNHIQLGLNRRRSEILQVLASITDSSTFAFFKFTFACTNKVDMDLDVFTNKFFP